MSDSLFADDDLDDGLADAGRLTAAFAAELGTLRDGLGAASRDLAGLEKGLTGGLRRAIDGLVLDGGRLSDALAAVGRSMADAVYAAALRPVTDGLGGLVAQGLEGAVGALAGTSGRVTPFAKGGVVAQATAFPMRGGWGLMGEAGPEAIMPLSRGPDGRLGVRAAGSPAPQVTINVSTPDVAGFARSQAQLAAEMSRLLARGARNR